MANIKRLSLFYQVNNNNSNNNIASDIAILEVTFKVNWKFPILSAVARLEKLMY